MIRKVRIDDAERICEIYNYYIENTVITFEEAAVAPREMEVRIQEVTGTLPWYVNESDGEISGYAYASKWKGRCAYRYSVETTVYIAHGEGRQGLGTELYSRLIESLKEDGYHTALAGIALPNEASRGLHEKLGFRKAAHFSEVGYKFDKWIDVGYWELRL